MSWRTWQYDAGEQAASQLADMIEQLMEEVAFELDDPPLNEWFDAGIEIAASPFGDEAVIVYHELEETDMTDVDGTMKPGYTLTIQMCDGQQDTQTFFADEPGDWRGFAEYFAKRIVCFEWVED